MDGKKRMMAKRIAAELRMATIEERKDKVIDEPAPTPAPAPSNSYDEFDDILAKRGDIKKEVSC